MSAGIERNLYMGGSGLTVCRLCLQHNVGGDGCQGRQSHLFALNEQIFDVIVYTKFGIDPFFDLFDHAVVYVIMK